MALQAVYDAAGRPGAAKLRDAARRRGLDVSLKGAQDFVRGQSTAQVFAAPPKVKRGGDEPTIERALAGRPFGLQSSGPREEQGLPGGSPRRGHLLPLCLCRAAGGQDE